jgi:hypothetical protein
MTQDEIIRFAIQCRLVTTGNRDGLYMDALMEFANLVAAKALAQPEQEQEPVATVENNSQQWKGMDGAIAFHLIERHADNWSDARKMMEEWLSANTSPPQRTWVGLTDEEVRQMCGSVPSMREAVRETEAKLKEKNT